MAIRKRKEVKGEPWVYDYKDPATGKRKLATPKSGLKKDAEALKRKIDAEIAAGLHTPVSETATVERFAEVYIADLDQRERDKRIGWSHAYKQRGIIKRYLVPVLGKVRFCDLKTDDVIRLYESMRKTNVIPRLVEEDSRRVAV